MLLAAFDGEPNWLSLTAQYGVCGVWIAWFHFAFNAQIKRDDRRHEENQRIQRMHAEGLERLNMLIITVLEQVGDFSPSALKKIVHHASESAQEAIRESRKNQEI